MYQLLSWTRRECAEPTILHTKSVTELIRQAYEAGLRQAEIRIDEFTYDDREGQNVTILYQSLPLTPARPRTMPAQELHPHTEYNDDGC